MHPLPLPAQRIYLPPPPKKKISSLEWNKKYSALIIHLQYPQLLYPHSQKFIHVYLDVLYSLIVISSSYYWIVLLDRFSISHLAQFCLCLSPKRRIFFVLSYYSSVRVSEGKKTRLNTVGFIAFLWHSSLLCLCLSPKINQKSLNSKKFTIEKGQR